jgi:hypothetical protein
MQKRKHILNSAAIIILLNAGMLYAGSTPNPEVQSLTNSYLAEAQKSESGLKAFSAEEGKRFFNSNRMHSAKKEERSCTTCHTTDPTKPGQTVAGKVIEPMAPSVNKERFTDPQKIEKWFKRNCEWVLERECTPKEKGEYITYMMSL